MRRALLLVLLLTTLPVATVTADRLAIVGARVVTMAGRTYDPGVVLIDGERIAAVGDASLDVPSGYETLDAAGRDLLPGLIDANTFLGLVEVDMEGASKELGKVRAADAARLRAVDGIHPASALIPVARLNGITTVLVSPGEQGVFSGQGAVIDLDGATVRSMVARSPASLHLNLGTVPTKGGDPGVLDTRMGRIAHVRAAFLKAREYRSKLERHQVELENFRIEQEFEARKKSEATTEAAEEEPDTTALPPLPPARDLELEALAAALEGEVPVFFRAQRADDILTAVDLAEEFGLRAVINHGAEAHVVAETLAAKDVPVVVGPINTQPSSFETLRASYANAARLHAAGVRIAIQTGDAHNVRNLPFMAGRAVAHGLPRRAALEAVTLEAARILGVADSRGSLEAGKVANLLLVEGDVLQPRSRIHRIWIRGREVPLESRQTRLRERFEVASPER